MAITAAVGAAVIGGVSAYSSIKESKEARKEATAMAQKQSEEQKKAMLDLKAQEDSEKKKAADRMASRLRSSGAVSRSSTILTSPLGITGTGPSGSAKTLIGQ